MSKQKKIIRDPIHGDIQFEEVVLDLIESAEIQRLYSIKQLGLTHLVFPGAHHTRLEHSLGTFYMAQRAGEIIGLKRDEKELIECAALLHDIGHGPFSHTLESLLRANLNVDHVDLTVKLINGEHGIFDEKETTIIEADNVFDILNQHGFDPKKVSNIIKHANSGKGYLGQLLNSSVDVDQLDYLVRDAYYTGVAYGMIDVDRFLQTLTMYDNNLAVEKKGVGVVENIFMARSLMYSSVYYHKTVRIAELMLSKAFEMMPGDFDPFDFFKMTDAELINSLKDIGGYQYEIATRLKYRKLFKQAYMISEKELDKERREIIKKLDNISAKRNKEKEFEEELGIPEGHVIIDIPYTELHLSEPRIDQTDIYIIDNKKVRSLTDYTPIGEAVKSRSVPEWDLMIVTDEKYKNIIDDKAERILFG